MSASGQAQEGQKQPERPPDEQEASASDLSGPLPVVIIESEEAAITRQRAEEEARNREQRDLIAQEGMQSEAKRMADYAVAQTFLILVGTIALIWTLLETRRMNLTARDIGQKQVRAYLAVRDSSFCISKDAKFFAFLEIENVGQSPAIVTKVHAKLTPEYINGEKRTSSGPDTTFPNRMVAAGSKEIFVVSCEITDLDTSTGIKGPIALNVGGTIHWNDVFDGQDETSFHATSLRPFDYFKDHADNVLSGGLQVFGILAQKESGDHEQ